MQQNAKKQHQFYDDLTRSEIYQFTSASQGHLPRSALNSFVWNFKLSSLYMRRPKREILFGSLPGNLFLAEFEMSRTKAKRVLIICYSYSGQTSGLLRKLAEGLERREMDVSIEKLSPNNTLQFPFGSIPTTLAMMLITFFRKRIPIAELSVKCSHEYDLIILAGPTWSYHPSGPVLSLFDRDGNRLFQGRTVIPLISCRGYWRAHWYGLRQKLRQCGATIPNLIVFTHPSREPWRTLGVFLKLAGKNPEQSRLMKKVYPKYGHGKNQLVEAMRFGELIGQALSQETSLEELNFKTRSAMP